MSATAAQNAIAVVGIDIGKNSFHIVALDDRGAIVLRQKWSRSQVETRFANMPPCLIAMKVLEQGQDLVAGPAIQRAGRFVGQDENRIIHHRARNDDALLLASGELIRPVMAAVGEADPVERLFGSTSSVSATSARVNKGQFDIFQRAGPRQKRRDLKDETDILAPDGRAYVFVQLYNFAPLQRIFAAVRSLQKAQEIHQGRLPRTRSAADGNKFTALDRERHVGYRTNDGLSGGIVFRNSNGLN